MKNNLTGENTSEDVVKLPVIHAGSLNTPFDKINQEFQRLNPKVELVDEWGGSVKLVREVDQGKTCGVLASADYNVISKLMFPKFADWLIIFTANKFILRFSDKSKYHEEINSDNWYEIVQKEEATFWRGDFNGDPGSYRALMVFQLAEKYYNKPGLYSKLMNLKGTGQLVAPKSVEQALEQIGLGYSFSYMSHVTQRGFKYVSLPDEINLSNPKFDDYYRQAKVEIDGNTTKEKIVIHGESILYGLTIPTAFENRELAAHWIDLLLGEKGEKIMKETGFYPIKPVVLGDKNKLPELLRKYRA